MCACAHAERHHRASYPVAPEPVHRGGVDGSGRDQVTCHIRVGCGVGWGVGPWATSLSTHSAYSLALPSRPKRVAPTQRTFSPLLSSPLLTHTGRWLFVYCVRQVPSLELVSCVVLYRCRQVYRAHEGAQVGSHCVQPAE